MLACQYNNDMRRIHHGPNWKRIVHFGHSLRRCLNISSTLHVLKHLNRNISTILLKSTLKIHLGVHFCSSILPMKVSSFSPYRRQKRWILYTHCWKSRSFNKDNLNYSLFSDNGTSYLKTKYIFDLIFNFRQFYLDFIYITFVNTNNQSTQ